MKKSIYIVILFFAYVLSCKDQGSEKKAGASKKADPPTTVQWIDSIKDIGKITEGEEVRISFSFKNTGTNPLVFSDVRATCGCTVVDRPEEPVMPGKQGTITAIFDSKNRVGPAHKTVIATCNTAKAVYELHFNGEVISKEQNSLNNNQIPQQPKSF